MYNIFESTKKIVEKLNNPNKNYWEDNDICWDRNAKAPDGNTYNEEELFEALKQSDKNRLLKFEKML